MDVVDPVDCHIEKGTAMDGERLDRLARLIGIAPSRRQVLKLLGGGLAGVAGGFVVHRTPTALAGTIGQFGDDCDTDQQCDQGQLLTCDDDRSTCRGDTGFACFDSGDCSGSDGLLCVDTDGAECTSDETECGTCGTVSTCAAAGESCSDDSCCDDLVCNVDNVCATAAPAGHATVTIHKATCPTGVGPDIFNQCHGNVLGGVSFAIDGFEIGSGVITTNDSGEASQTILEAAETGGVTITEDAATFANYIGAYVYCAEQNSGTVLFDGSADTGAVNFTASQGDDIVCDWYNLTSAASEPPATTGGVTTLPATGGAPGETAGTLSGWLGAAALGGAAAFLAGKKLRDGNRPAE
jgi:hypothetical protein